MEQTSHRTLRLEAKPLRDLVAFFDKCSRSCGGCGTSFIVEAQWLLAVGAARSLRSSLELEIVLARGALQK
eukprot:2362218-Amphidinium_carterae.1